MWNALFWALALFLLTILAGFWLLKTGKPYRSGIFNLHKLLALGAVVLVFYRLFNRSQVVDSLTWLVLGLAVLAVVILFASGAIMSIGKPDHPAVLLSHRVAAVLATAVAGWIAYLVVTGSL